MDVFLIINTGHCVLQVTISCKNFLDIPDILICQDKRILVVVEERRPHCWSCSTAGHLFKACLGKNTAPQPLPTTIGTTEAMEKDKSVKAPDGHGDWKGVMRKRQKEVTPIPQQDIPQQEQKRQQQGQGQRRNCKQQEKE